MSAARRLARFQAKKGGGAAISFAKVAEALQGIKQLGGTLEGMLPEAKTSVEMLTDKLRELEYQMERQRIVSLRMYQSVGFADIDVDDAEDLLALQERYEAEYDGMRFLQWIATLTRREEP